MEAEIIAGRDGELAGRLLREGKLGILPCDTIYGISGLADKETAERIYQVKRRPKSKAFIILMDKPSLIRSRLIVPEDLLDRWPAPFTAILKAPDGSTHAVRVPDDEFVQEVLAISGPIYSTSVNISGERTLSSFDEIYPVFRESVDFIVRDPSVSGGIPSTLIDATVSPYRILRQGSYVI